MFHIGCGIFLFPGPKRREAKRKFTEALELTKGHGLTEHISTGQYRRGKVCYPFSCEDERQVSRMLAVHNCPPVDFSIHPVTRDEDGRLQIGKPPAYTVWDSSLLQVAVDMLKQRESVTTAAQTPINTPAGKDNQDVQ